MQYGCFEEGCGRLRAACPTVYMPVAEDIGREFCKKLNFFQKTLDKRKQTWYYINVADERQRQTEYAPLAQLDRVFDYESKGHRFESCVARQ